MHAFPYISICKGLLYKAEQCQEEEKVPRYTNNISDPPLVLVFASRHAARGYWWC